MVRRWGLPGLGCEPHLASCTLLLATVLKPEGSWPLVLGLSAVCFRPPAPLVTDPESEALPTRCCSTLQVPHGHRLAAPLCGLSGCEGLGQQAKPGWPYAVCVGCWTQCGGPRCCRVGGGLGDTVPTTRDCA